MSRETRSPGPWRRERRTASTLFPSDPGFTCCQAINLLNPTSTLAERVGLVLTRGPFHVGNAWLAGDAASDRLLSSLWPSDHAGVVVALELEKGG